MAWQVKRYKALMRSFTREADAKVVALNSKPALPASQPLTKPPS